MKTLKINTNRWIAAGTLSAMTLGTAIAAQPVQAGSSTWKKVAIGAAAVTGYGLVKGNGKVATIGAVAAAGSYYMYDRAKDKEKKQGGYGDSAQNITVEGTVISDTRGNGFTLRTANGQQYFVQVQGGEAYGLSYGDTVRVFGATNGNRFYAKSMRITANR